MLKLKFRPSAQCIYRIFPKNRFRLWLLDHLIQECICTWSNMDEVSAALFLGIDSLCFGYCLLSYLKSKTAVDAIKKAPFLELNSKLEQFVRSQPNHKVPYCIIRGTIKSLGIPLNSMYGHNVTGVIQKLKTDQHLVIREASGMWSKQDQTIQEVLNVVPFALQSGETNVEVLEAIRADILDLETIVVTSIHHESITSIGIQIWGQRNRLILGGLYPIEEMLREGALITGVGELSLDSRTNCLTIQPPNNGTPFYLTSLPLSSLIRKLEGNERYYRMMATVFGSVSLVLLSFISQRWISRDRRTSD